MKILRGFGGETKVLYVYYVDSFYLIFRQSFMDDIHRVSQVTVRLLLNLVRLQHGWSEVSEVSDVTKEPEVILP